MRPVYAAQALFDAAVGRIGLTNEDRVDPAIQRLANSKGIPFKKTQYFVYLKNAKKTMRQLAQSPIDDGWCMVQTLDRLQEDVELLVARANAWAEGDVQRLKSLPFNDQKKACIAAMADNDAARAQGLSDPEGAARERWLRITRESLDIHNVVFAQYQFGSSRARMACSRHCKPMATRSNRRSEAHVVQFVALHGNRCHLFFRGAGPCRRRMDADSSRLNRPE